MLKMGIKYNYPNLGTMFYTNQKQNKIDIL